ncbi:PQQ-like beta-propeller repeat protein [Cellulomonas sp. P24]|uniref:PQQ-like beta-propeller repeat protein n=1 Tax=Cellulomonas sp. P24 TaxID=2885206 RepID=UPI00216B0753|nr:PQQ-like beta-propeller repeat protein [Cellulomonas sp. P24]MCR6492192.1 PQQ-like beta-propeller repeat protein [Cellulomonas sp. P24]
MGGERAQRTQDVELVEVEPDGGPSAVAGRPEGEAGRPAPVRVGWRRRYRWWLASGLVVLVGVTPSVVHAVQERVRLAQLAGVTGIAAPIDGPVHERWSVDATFQALGEVGGDLIGTVRSGTGVPTVRGIDATTGAVRWSFQVAVPGTWGGGCVLTDGPVSGQDKAVLACLVVDEAQLAPAGDSSLGPPAKVHLATLDPRTGAVLGTVRADPLDTIAALGSDVAIASHQTGPTGGESTVRRWDPRTGTVAWTARHPDPPGGGGSSTGIQESGGVLLVQNMGEVWEVSASGTELRSWSGLSTDGVYSLWRTAGGHVLRATYVQVAAPPEDATVSTYVVTDGTAVITDLGENTTFRLAYQNSVLATVDDGSAPDLLLVAGSDPVAYDLRTGHVIWRVHHGIDAFVVLDGTVYAVGAGTVSAIDARTGATRWTAHHSFSASPAMLATDGRSLIVMSTPAGSSVSTVEALDLENGTVTWTSTLSQGFDALEVVGGRLAVLSYTEAGRLTVLG